MKKFVAATFLDTALSLRETTTQAYYEKELAHLYETAKSVLADIAIKNRQRAAPNLAFLSTAIKADEPVTVAILEKLRAATLSMANHLVQQAKLDQEEINILWWLTSGFANSADNKISKLEPGAAAYCCGIELADLSAGPPSTSIFKILNRALEMDRAPATTKETALTGLINSWLAPLDLQILTRDPKQLHFAEQYPMLSPLAWLSRKLHNTGAAKNWAEEFHSATGVSATKIITPMGLGHQLIKERMALRLA